MTSAKKPRDHEGPALEEEEAPTPGDQACWAHLVCPECGAVVSEGHRPGCDAARSERGD